MKQKKICECGHSKSNHNFKNVKMHKGVCMVKFNNKYCNCMEFKKSNSPHENESRDVRTQGEAENLIRKSNSENTSPVSFSQEELVLDIHKMLIVLQALTPRETEGEKILKEWIKKYSNSQISHLNRSSEKVRTHGDSETVKHLVASSPVSFSQNERGRG